jgi:hypothetical protein
VKSTIWVPKAISVGGAADGSDLLALVIDDEHETVIVPLAGGDARRIGAALLGVEIPDTLEHAESCLSNIGGACDCSIAHGTFDG